MSAPAARALVLALLAGWLACSPALATSAQDWNGIWDSRWLGGGARVYLKQEEDKVVGRYPAYTGMLEGRVEGKRLIGTWSAPKGSGTFEFILAEDGRSFIGRFGKNQWWTGSRILPDDERNLKPLQSTPAETLRTFLVAADAVESGRLEYQDDLIALMVFPENDQANHVRELGPLALLMNQFTVDPDVFETRPPSGERAQLVLTRYDGRTLPLEFRRINDDWFMVPPSPEAVKTMLKQIVSEADSGLAPRVGLLAMDTPRATMEAFLDAMRAGPAMQDTALAALDLSEMPPVVRDREAVLAAEYLNEVLARIGEVIFQEIPNDPGAREPFVYFMHAAGDIVLAPTETADGLKWKFTPETLRSIRSLYAATENLPPAVRILPYDAHSKATYFRIRALVAAVAPTGLRSAGPLEVWQWIALATVFACAALASIIGGFLLLSLRRLLWQDAGAEKPAPYAVWGIRLLVFGAISYAGFAILGLPSEFASVVKTLAVLTIIVGTIPIEFWVIDHGHRAFDRAGLISARGEILASLLVGVIKVLIICANILLFAEALRIPYGAALAGLGMGGIAIALAARSTLENVISGFILFADRPVDVGEFGRFDGRIGTVERIGLRATTIRTIERTLISIPNAEFVGLHLENFTRRDSILMRRTFALRPETEPDQLRFVLTEVRRLLVGHPRVTADPARVRFTGVEHNRIEVEIFAYIRSTDWSEFLAIQEDLFLRMMTIVANSGTDFAYPAQTLYFGRDRGIDKEKGTRAAEEVDGWRRGGHLPFPNLTAEEIAEIENALPYPPEGAAQESEHPAHAAEAPPAAPRRSLFWPFGG
ncbi:mechanosensitive ion channel family protein [Stappia sp.]|uniref:mechanosensitive ion channel family protein n=1 Tax=Stappia sp. TaxID=1870903 RepID=UPI003A9976CE